MDKKFSSRNKIGLPPGSLVYTGESKESVKISLIEFNDTLVEEKVIDNIQDLKLFKENDKISWINITGLSDVKLLEDVGNIFEIHPLTLEDILNVYHSPKMDEYENYLFIISKMIVYDKLNDELNIEHVCFVLGKNFIITFQETEGDVFDIIRDRIRSNKGRVRKQKADYLMYRLLDSIVDNYLIVLECYDERIEKIEDELMLVSDDISLEPIHDIRKEITKIKRLVTPLSEIMHSFQKEKIEFIQKNTKVFLRDLYDHTKHVVDATENYREQLNGLLQIYLSATSHKMNNIVRLLTIISTIFIPLTFVVGIYGMNFNPQTSKWNMPELHWQYGYPFVMLMMFVIAVGLIIFFKKKKWL